jgi:hypothetical protein
MEDPRRPMAHMDSIAGVGLRDIHTAAAAATAAGVRGPAGWLLRVRRRGRRPYRGLRRAGTLAFMIVWISQWIALRNPYDHEDDTGDG